MDKAHGLARVYTLEEEALVYFGADKGLSKTKVIGKSRRGKGWKPTRTHTLAPPLLFIITHRL